MYFPRRNFALFEEGSAELVVAHAMRQRSRGRAPSLSYRGISNPRSAFMAALREYEPQTRLRGDIVFLEPDYLQAGYFLPRLANAFPNANIRWVETEKDFLRIMNTHYAESAPVMVVSDVFVSWSYQLDQTTHRLVAHPDGKNFMDGGLRVYDWLQAQSHLAPVPFIFHTLLTPDDVLCLRETTIPVVTKTWNLTALKQAMVKTGVLG